LWLIVPVGFISWCLLSPWLLWRHVSPGQFLGWLDSNFVFVLETSILRAFFVEPTIEWIPAKHIRLVTHRIGVFDFF
jgi:hypothetical protein